jgi:hypothetical protein
MSPEGVTELRTANPLKFAEAVQAAANVQNNGRDFEGKLMFMPFSE